MTKIFLSLFVSLCLMSPLPPVAQAGTSFGIAATVNKDAISKSDLNDRMRLIFASSGIKNTKQNSAKLRPQALNSLIEEQLKLQEAARQNLTVSQEEIDNGFAALAGQNKLNTEQFSAVLKQQGIPKSTLLSQVKSQIAWTKVIGSILRPQIDVSENDVNAKMQRVKESMGKAEYLTSEIFLPVNTNEEEEKTKQLAQKLIEEIKAGRATFDTIAAQFSKSSGAAENGSLGWVQDGQLPKELDLVVSSLSEGQISPPVRGLSGFHILTVTQRRAVSGATIPTQDEILNSIGLERLERLQQRYLSDIKSAAFIDHRR